MKWNLKSSHVPHNLNELRDILLKNRGLTTPAEKELFFHPPHPITFSPASVGIDPEQMAKAVERIHQAKENGEDVLIFGDYDADGICSTAVLWEALKSIGIVARPFIPHREKHGYGLSERSLEVILKEKKPDLLITVDNGIVAHAAFARLQTLGIDAILTDHHQTEDELPPAYAIVHTTQLCGAGVAWMLARELNREAALASLDLVGIATIADQMSLLGPCRAFVKHGLESLRSTQRIGLQLLCAKAGIEQSQVEVGTVNFAIAPRINAMGRLKHGIEALRLLCTKNMVKAEALVNELNDTNTSRQELTLQMVEHAIDQEEIWEHEHIIIVHSKEYHEGVIGLIAGKLMEKYYKPAIAIAVNEEGNIAKASARSIPGVNIIDLIRLVREDLLEAGGHPMAAGFGLLPEKIAIVKEKLLKISKEQISAELLIPAIDVEVIMPADLVCVEAFDVIQELAPFGNGNRSPIIGIKNVLLLNAMTIGKEHQHLKVTLGNAAGDNRCVFTGLGWGMGELTDGLTSHLATNPMGIPVEVAGTIDVNEWKNKRTAQMIIKAIEVRPLRNHIPS